METVKITKKMRYEEMITIFEKMGEDYADYVKFCENEIELLAKKAVKAKESAAKKKAETDELMVAVEAALPTNEFYSIADIAARIEGDDVTIAKVTYRLTQLWKNGVAEKQEITVCGGEGQKSRKVQGYRKLA